MISITCGIGYFLAILVVDVFSTDYTLLSEQKSTLHGPFHFGYDQNNFLLMEITLKNISPSVTAVFLKYNKYYNKHTWPFTDLETIKGNIEKTTSEVKFMILKHLINSQHIEVDVELYGQHGICDTTKIAEGRDVTTLKTFDYTYSYRYNEHYKYYYDVTKICLEPKLCEIIVDLKNKCPNEQASPYFSCYLKESQYVCTFNIQDDTSLYRFYQTYDNSSYIGPVPVMEATRIKLFIKLELFDDNTSINVASYIHSYNTRKKNIIWSKNLSLSTKDISEDYSSVTTQTYSETNDVEYSCQQYISKTKYLHVGFIDSTDNRIKTINQTSLTRKFKKADNGTILCCLYYTSTRNRGTFGQEVHITRFVENKILLIYQLQEYHTLVRRPSTNSIESETQVTITPPNNGLVWYLVPSVLGLCVLMLSLYIIKLKLCTNPRPVEETLELDNQATQNQVLYANLDLVRDATQSQERPEESPYANIIGVLHPLAK